MRPGFSMRPNGPVLGRLCRGGAPTKSMPSVAASMAASMVLRRSVQTAPSQPQPQPQKKVKPHEKHVVVDTKVDENLRPSLVAPLVPASMPRGNLIAHILEQYKGDTGKYNKQLSGWQKALGENVIRIFGLDMDRIRSGPVAGAMYADMCKGQAYFEKDKPLTPTAEFWFKRLGLPQTFFGWYQVTTLHVWILYVRMRAMPRRYGREYQQKLVNGVFDDMDFQLREVMRVNSDRTVNKYKKEFSQQLRGAVFGYDESMLGGDTVLASALWRNMFMQSPVTDASILEHLVHYVRAQLYVLDRMSDADFAAGKFRFLDPRMRYEPLNQEQNDALTEMIESARKEPALPGNQTKLSRQGW